MFDSANHGKKLQKNTEKAPKNCTLLFYSMIFQPAGSGTLELNQTEKHTFLAQGNAEKEKWS